jgi:hypothetical protein
LKRLSLSYPGKVAGAWIATVTGTVVGAVLLVVSLVTRGALTPWTAPAVVVGGVVAAQYLVWRAATTELQQSEGAFVKLMGGDWNIMRDPVLARRVAQAFWSYQLSGHDLSTLYNWTRMALQGVELDHVTPNQTPRQTYELILRDATDHRGAPTPLTGRIESCDYNMLRGVEAELHRLVAALKAEYFRPAPPTRQVPGII